MEESCSPSISGGKIVGEVGGVLRSFKGSRAQGCGEAERLGSENKSREGVDDRGNEEDDYSNGEGTIGKKLLFRRLVKDKGPSSLLTLECYSPCELPKGVRENSEENQNKNEAEDKEPDC